MMIEPRAFIRRVTAAVAATLLVPAFLSGQAAAPIGDAAFDDAFFAWESGDYPAALAGLDRLVNGPDAHRYLEPVALLTGELFRTVELTTDGLAPRWAPDSRHVAWETGAGAERVTHIALIEDGAARTIATVEGGGLRFGSDGSAYYIEVPENGELRSARLAVETAQESGDREALFAARSRVSDLERSAARLVRRDPAGATRVVDTGDLLVQAVMIRPGDDAVHVLGAPADAGNVSDVYRLTGGAPAKVTRGPGPKMVPAWVTGHVVYGIDRQSFAVENLTTGEVTSYRGTQLTTSADGSAAAFVRQEDGTNIVTVLRFTDAGVQATDVVQRAEPVSTPSLSPDGRRLAYQMMPREDWEIYVTTVVAAANGANDAAEPVRLTRDVQHDLFPTFVDANTILAVKGEGRHRRSFLYDTRTREQTRLFHNNTVRTVAPEYSWDLSPDRSKVLILAERDGDTVTPERGVYVTDLSSRVTVEDVRERVSAQLAHETALREKGRTLFAGIEDAVAGAVAEISKDRAYRYAHDLYQFDSKHITQPGNAQTIEYLTAKLREFGYEPELQWFEVTRGGQTIRTANVIAVLPGTVHPDVLYTVSSHFDSVERGPGADDNTSGTTALLEVARVLATRPQPATLHFAFFTGEEAGLLGSREYVRRAVERGDQLVGALNNDMIGYANDQRLDNTIRYSNDGIRDIQHAAAFLFTDLITYDAKYYKSTDAHAYYDAYGDIVGGIGSYPILANPHYHQTHDQLETINQQLVAEVAKATAATLMQLASRPSRPKLAEVRPSSARNELFVSWERLPESDVTGYIVRVVGADGREKSSSTVAADAALSATVPYAMGDVVEVWAENARGRSWDAARAQLTRLR